MRYAFLVATVVLAGAVAIVGFSPRVAARRVEDSAARRQALAVRAGFWGVNLDQKVSQPDSFWRLVLTGDQYDVTRRAGTEAPWSGKYERNHDDGVYRCIDCGNPLFDSRTKFESGTGWPSFWQPISRTAVREHVDRSDGMVREEVVCARCGAHLGHVFDDGPPPTHLRYCMNSVALDFAKRAEKAP